MGLAGEGGVPGHGYGSVRGAILVVDIDVVVAR